MNDEQTGRKRSPQSEQQHFSCCCTIRARESPKAQCGKKLPLCCEVQVKRKGGRNDKDTNWGGAL